MPRSSPFRATLALTALLAASCDHNPAVPAPGEAEFATSASLPAVPGFTARANIQGSNPRKVTFTWQNVAGEDVFLIQWRVGDAGNWRSLVTTARDHTTFGTDSVRAGQRNYYRIAAMTSAYLKGPFTTVLLMPSVQASSPPLQLDSVAQTSMSFRNLGPPLTYLVEYGTDPGLADAVQTPGITSSDPQGSLSFHIPVVPGTTYYYRARGAGDGVTVYDSIRTFVGARFLQATFHQLPFEPPVGSGLPGYRVELAWTHSGIAAQSYRIQRRTLGQQGWPQIAEADSGATGFIDTTVPISSGQTYQYRVEACIGTLCTVSALAQVVTVGMPAPADFVVAHTQGDSVMLRWGDLADEEAFVVERRIGTDPAWVTIAAPGKSIVSFATRVVAGKINYFRVAGRVSQGRAGEFASSSALTWPALTVQTSGATVLPPTSATLTGLVSFIGSLPTTAWFEWTTTSGHTYTTPPELVDSGIVSATINFLGTGTYTYRIHASNGRVSTRGVSRTVYVGVPPPPELTAASYSLAEHVVHLAWTHSGSENLAYFQIVRWGPFGTDFNQRVAADTRTFTDVMSWRNVTLRYTVRACNAATQCASSLERAVVVPPMAPPSGITATLQADGKVRVQWQDMPGQQAYLVQWRTSSATSWKMLVSTGMNATEYTTSSVTAGTTNYYRVAASAYGAGLFGETSLVVP